ncbi:DUF2061 domain-containing protein [Pontibacter sp. JAM-7]|uniref:DUF2061 domain-containing protein n=1 Tax=Pontibacter sp. JAM-7 TaxID=3366581 RepID=UPI003AF7AFB2
MSNTVSCAFIHFTIALGVNYIMTGNRLAGSAAALDAPAINTAAFYLHEQF